MKSYVNVSDTEKRPIEKSGDDLILGEVVPRRKPVSAPTEGIEYVDGTRDTSGIPGVFSIPTPRSTAHTLLDQEDKGIEPSTDALLDPRHQEFGDQTAILRGDFYALVVKITPRMEPEGYWNAIARSLTRKWFGGNPTNWFSGNIHADLEYPASYVDLALHNIVSHDMLDMYSIFDKHSARIIDLVNDGLRVVVVRDSGAPQSVSLEFSSYINPERTFSAWLDAMSTGARGIPLPILLAMLETFDLHTKGDVLEKLQQQISVGDARGLIDEYVG